MLNRLPSISASAVVLATCLLPPLVAQGAWSGHPTPTQREAHAVALDFSRGRVVLFGGAVPNTDAYQSMLFGDTWEWDGTGWIRQSPSAAPSARFGHAMVFDALRNRVVLFGGDSGGLPGAGRVLESDTWEWDGANWTQRATTTSPPARSHHAMAFDLASGRTLLHGGRGAGGTLQDTWVFDGTDWTVLNPATPGPTVEDARMVFDPLRNRAVLFGGYDDSNGSVSADTWEFDGVNWRQLIAAVGPQARSGCAMAFDIVRGRTVMFGGTDPVGGIPLTDTWEFDGSNWNQITPQHSPTCGIHSRLVVDLQAGGVILVAGSEPEIAAVPGSPIIKLPTAQVWRWNGADWSVVRRDPRGRGGLGLSAAPGGDVLLFGGSHVRPAALGDTWRWDGDTWHELSPANSPGARTHHAMEYDPRRDRVVVFGGTSSGIANNETWEWDGLDWTRAQPPTSPGALHHVKMAWDDVGQRIVLFGGIGFLPTSETWAYDGATWTQLSPANTPPARASQAMASAPDRGRIVMFGGTGAGFLGDTWEWNGSNWLFRNTPTAPSPRRGAAMAHDPRRGRTVLHGGFDSGGVRNDSWEWNGTTWTQLNAPGPAAVEAHGMVFDRARGELFCFGGEAQPQWLAQSWTFAAIDDAGYEAFGTGCGGAGGAPELAADGWSLPWAGSSFTARVSNLRAGAPALMYTGFSDTSWSGGSLPFGLGIIGMGGCSLLVSPDVPFPFTPSGSTSGTWTLPLPTAPSIIGLEFFNQALALDPTANALGLSASNGAKGTIGRR